MSAEENWPQRFTRITKGRPGGNFFFFFPQYALAYVQTHTNTYKGIDGPGYGDLAAQLGLVLRDLLSADQHLPGPGKKSAGLMRKAELKFQPASGTRYMLFLSQVQD